MKLIVGLGNPGEKYEKNRHNVGFMVVDQLATKVTSEKWEVKSKFNAEIIQTKNFILAKPQTFMNDSGVAVAAICNFYKIKNEDVYIIHDDLDIQLGNYKIQFSKGPKVHNGLKSVEEKLWTDQFFNVRIGVENREVRGNAGVPGVVYSLQDFVGEEKEIIDGVVNNICKELGSVLQGETS